METNSNSVRNLLDQRTSGSESWGGDVLTTVVPENGLIEAKKKGGTKRSAFKRNETRRNREREEREKKRTEMET